MAEFSEDRRKYTTAARLQARERHLSKTPIPERITTALDLRGLYGPEVDRACGVGEPTVDQWEAGEVVPTREQVEALARLTDYPVTFFYTPGPKMLGPIFLCGEDGCDITDNRPEPKSNVVELFRR